MQAICETYTNYEDYFQHLFMETDPRTSNPGLTMRYYDDYADSLTYIPKSMRDFMLYSYNTDSKCINSLQQNKNFSPEYLESLSLTLVRKHTRYITDIIKTIRSFNSGTFASKTSYNTTKAMLRKFYLSIPTISTIKSLHFVNISAFLIPNANSVRFDSFSSYDLRNWKDSSLYVFWKMFAERNGLDFDMPNGQQQNLIALIKKLIKKHKTDDPDFTLTPCLNFTTIAMQLYFKFTNPEVLKTIDKGNSIMRLVCKEDFSCDIIKDTIKRSKYLQPLLKVRNDFDYSHLTNNLLNCLHIPNKLNYSNVEILKLLINFFRLEGNDFKRTILTENPIYRDTYIPRLLFNTLTSPTSSLFKIEVFSKNVKRYLDIFTKPVQDKELSFFKESSRPRIFTPSQENFLVLNTLDIQNKILDLIATDPKVGTRNSNELIETIKTFHKIVYKYYCKLNNLDSSKPYTLATELASYAPSECLRRKFDTLLQALNSDDYVVASQITHSPPLLNNPLIHYMDFLYPTDFINDLQSTIDRNTVNSLYDSYVKEVFEPLLSKITVLNEDCLTVPIILEMQEYVAKEIPYHYIRLCYLNTFSSNYFKDAITYFQYLNSMNTFINVSMLEFVSILAFSD